MVGSLVFLALIGVIVVVGIALAVLVGVLLHRVLRSRASVTGTAAGLAGAAAGLAVFIGWCLVAGVVLFILANIAASRT